MKKYLLKDKIKKIKKSTWIFWGIMTAFVILAIAVLLVAMHLCGYTLARWLNQFGAYLVIIIAVILLIVGSAVLIYFRKGNRK